MSNIAQTRRSVDADAYLIPPASSERAFDVVGFLVLAFLLGLVAVFMVAMSRLTPVVARPDASVMMMYGP